MEKKYELTDETIEYKGKTLYRIVALKDFGFVEAGDFGGYVESESNLSQDGNCWVDDYAKVYDSAIVRGSAIVSGYATVGDYAEVGGHATVCDYAEVGCAATISGSAIVGGYATVSGHATVVGLAEVVDSAIVSGTVTVSGSTEVRGNAKIYNCNDYVVIQNCWSNGRCITYTRSNYMYKVGCFYGNRDELIKETYKEDVLKGKCCEATLKYIEEIYKIIENEKAK